MISVRWAGFLGHKLLNENNFTNYNSMICRSQVYETVEMLVLKPDEVIKMIKQSTTEMAQTPAGEPKGRFRRLIPAFGSKGKNSKEHDSKNCSVETQTHQPLASFFDSKSSLFSKKPPRPGSSSPEKNRNPDESEWTIV